MSGDFLIIFFLRIHINIHRTGQHKKNISILDIHGNLSNFDNNTIIL